MAKTVIKRPAKISSGLSRTCPDIIKKRVAGYARVSTDKDEQLTSYEAQLDYYSNYIRGHDDWEFVGMYSDEGITGTSTKRRDGFNKMVSDAKMGKIDLIITKSVSRFARNTVDSLTTIRELKERGVGILFEKENIDTMDSKGELLITIMSSLAQEESRSISENTTWGQRKRFADGKGSVGYSNFLGYDKDFKVNKEQAEVVKEIYRLFLGGLTYHAIAVQLTERGIKTPSGKDIWGQRSVESILTNEKYKGDALLQKSYTADFLTKKMVPNEGELPQYYVENHHEGIIDREVWDIVQMEVKRRKEMGPKYSGISIFSTRIKCGECGCWYGSKVWHSTDKYRRTIWQCNGKYKKRIKCSSPALTEEQIKEVFLDALARLADDKNEVIGALEETRQTYFETESLESRIEEILQERETVVARIKAENDDNAHAVRDQEKKRVRIDRLLKRIEKLDEEHAAIEEQIQQRAAADAETQIFIKTLQSIDGTVTEFDDVLWTALLDSITIYSPEDIRVSFKGGREVVVGIRKGNRGRMIG